MTWISPYEDSRQIVGVIFVPMAMDMLMSKIPYT